jgi:two-component system, chemotaxis family, chemotaxis protein CheY
MDIMMPNVDGKEAVTRIRQMEVEFGIKGSSEVKIIMVTALGDPKTVVSSFYKCGATSYIVKPVIKKQLEAELKNLGLIQ